MSAPAGSKVQLSFENFDLEESEHCNKDYIDVYVDGPHGTHIGRFVSFNMLIWLKILANLYFYCTENMLFICLFRKQNSNW